MIIIIIIIITSTTCNLYMYLFDSTVQYNFQIYLFIYKSILFIQCCCCCYPLKIYHKCILTSINNMGCEIILGFPIGFPTKKKQKSKKIVKSCIAVPLCVVLNLKCVKFFLYTNKYITGPAGLHADRRH